MLKYYDRVTRLINRIHIRKEEIAKKDEGSIEQKEKTWEEKDFEKI